MKWCLCLVIAVEKNKLLLWGVWPTKQKQKQLTLTQQQKKHTFLFTSNVAPLNRVIASCSKLHSALLLQPLVGHQTGAPNLFELRGEVLKPFGCVCSWDFTWRCLQMPLRGARREEKRFKLSVFGWHTELDRVANLLSTYSKWIMISEKNLHNKD